MKIADKVVFVVLSVFGVLVLGFVLSHENRPHENRPKPGNCTEEQEARAKQDNSMRKFCDIIKS